MEGSFFFSAFFLIAMIVAGVLYFILFCKIWTDCNNIQQITDKFVYDGLSTIREYSENDTYKVGDIVRLNGVDGVVFEVSDGGKHGKVVSVQRATNLQWASSAEKGGLIGVNDENDGAVNMAKVKQIEDWHERFPAFAWCANLGDGWYLPAKEELLTMNRHKGVLNAFRSMKVLTDGYCWSSTEDNNSCAWSVFMFYGSTPLGYDKIDGYYVRAVSAF